MKKIPLITTFVTLIMLILAWFMLFPLFINQNTVKVELQKYFLQMTGMPLEIQGDMVVKMDLMPHIIFNQLYVINAPAAKNSFFLSINNADIYPVFSSLLTGKIQIKKIKVHNFVINFEKSKEGVLNSKQLSNYWNGNSSPQMPSASANDTVIEADSSSINYFNSTTDTLSEFNDINASLSMLNSSSINKLNCSFNYRDKIFTASSDISGHIANIGSNEKHALTLNVASGKTVFNYEGDMHFDTIPVLNGDISVESDDVAEWIKLLNDKDAKLVTATDYQKLPVALKTKIAMQDNKKIQFPNLILTGDIITGKMSSQITLPNEVEIDADIANLNLEAITNNSSLFATKEKEKIISERAVIDNKMDMHSKKIEPLSISTTLKIDNIDYNKRHIKNTRLSVDYSSEDIVIPQLLSVLPGNSLLSFSGLGRNGINGLILEGQIDIQGNSFADMINLFKISQINLPAEDFKRFHLKGNSLLSLKEFRMSELAARIEKIGVVGGFIIKFGATTSLQSALNISSLNLDNIIKLWAIEDWRKAFLNNNTITNNAGIVSVVLRNLNYEVLANTSLENYTLGEKVYAKANIDMELTKNKINFKGVEAQFKGSKLSGKMSIDVSKEIPKVDAEASFDQINMVDFFNLDTKADVAENAKPQEHKDRWSNEVFDFSVLDLFNATFKLKIDHLVNNYIDVKNATIEGEVNDRKVNIEKLIATITSDARLSAKGTIVGGAIPGFAMQVSIFALKPEQFVHLLPIFSPISGSLNFTSNLTTTGISVLSWISNVEGSIGVTGKDMEIHQFNLPGIIRAVTYVRTVADILNVVKRAFPSGNTVFPKIDGQWSVSKGILETSSAKIYNSQADGSIASKFDIVNWKIQNSVTFALKTLDANNIPNMIVNVYGDFNHPTVDFDTRSLEQYVNNKTSENLLNEYGTQQ